MVRQKVPIEDNGKIRCDACPVLCYIKDGRSGACDRYANDGGELVRVDPLTLLRKARHSETRAIVEFLPSDSAGDDWDGDLMHAEKPFITAVGAGTTYPDYKPAPFIVSQQHEGVDMVTVVTEGIFTGTIEPGCPKSSEHAFRRWKHPDVCPKCGSTMVRGERVTIWD